MNTHSHTHTVKVRPYSLKMLTLLYRQTEWNIRKGTRVLLFLFQISMI